MLLFYDGKMVKYWSFCIVHSHVVRVPNYGKLVIAYTHGIVDKRNMVTIDYGIVSILDLYFWC